MEGKLRDHLLFLRILQQFDLMINNDKDEI
jgi:hypothetical protein